MGSFETFVNQSKSLLAKVPSNRVRDHLNGFGYNSSIPELPEYFRPHGFAEMQLEPLDWGKRSLTLKTTYPLELTAAKGSTGWRRYALVHPYSYWHLVNEMANEESWAAIRERLARPNAVACYSLPLFETPSSGAEGHREVQLRRIALWVRFAEQDLITEATKFRALGVTDIQNFYPSIYTHALAWAVNGYDIVRRRRNDYSLTGNRLDRLFQSARGGQTNGIPIGTMVSDIASELLLSASDETLSGVLERGKSGDDVVVARFRDDYRILGTSVDSVQSAIRAIRDSVSSPFDLSLNAAKTAVEHDALSRARRPWMTALSVLPGVSRVCQANTVNAKEIADALMEIYLLQMQYPLTRVAVRALIDMNRNLMREGVRIVARDHYLRIGVAVLRSIIVVQMESVGIAFRLIDRLVELMTDEYRRLVIDEMKVDIGRHNHEELYVVWLHRLLIYRDPVLASRIASDSGSKLLKMVVASPNDVDVFPLVENVSVNDEGELRKFRFVDRSRLVELSQAPLMQAGVALGGPDY